MDIRGFIPTSMVDWDGQVVSTIFTPKCNFDCAFCYNHKLVNEPEAFGKVSVDKIMDHLEKNKDFLDGVCITGGEPTLQQGLYKFCEKIKAMGLKVKLDTNGTNPVLLRGLIQKKLVDYIAMDVKAPVSAKKYKKVIGSAGSYLVENVKASIQMLLTSGVDYEFRTTVVPGMHTKEDLREIARDLNGCKKYIIQKFQPDNAHDEKLRVKKTQSDAEMDDILKVVRKYVPNSKWRGK